MVIRAVFFFLSEVSVVAKLQNVLLGVNNILKGILVLAVKIIFMEFFSDTPTYSNIIFPTHCSYVW